LGGSRNGVEGRSTNGRGHRPNEGVTARQKGAILASSHAENDIRTMRTHDALAVANWFLARAESEGKTLDPMKLQKLIYFAHGWALALADVPLISERPQAWEFGPVIPVVYHEFKSFGRKPIRGRAATFDWSVYTDTNSLLNLPIVEPTINDDPDAEALLDRIWEVYGSLSGIQLSNMTHMPDGAWHKAYHDVARGRRGVDISDELVKTEFVRKIRYGANTTPSGN
jgi:uncharacterized phage-associated protein